MGGWGSGRWPRTRDGLFEQVRRIDVRQLQREGVLRTGWTGAYSWTTDGKPSASVSLVFVDDVLLLGYEYRPRGAGEPITVERRVHIEWTPCNYGGRRSWFRCPACGHRMAHVFVADERIACRRCLNLRYASQTEGRVDLASRKARRTRARLGGGKMTVPLPWKPPRMHWRTYERLRREEGAAQPRSLAGMLALLNRSERPVVYIG